MGKHRCAAVMTFCFFCGQLAEGQIKFVQVQSSVGLNHNVLYGPPFDFSSDPEMAQIKRVMQKNMGNGAAVGDYDNDGDPDIYLLGQSGSANRLYRNNLVGGARIFTNVAVAAGVADTGFGRTAQFADLDNDGWDDLILLNDSLPLASYPPSKIFRNNGDGTFSDMTTPTSNFVPDGLIKGGMCLGDYDSDGLLDIYVGLWLMELGEGTPGFAGHNHLYRNLGNFKFQDVTVSSGLGLLQRDCFSCAFADFDNDSDADLYVAVDHTSDAYYGNNGDGTFTDLTVAVGATHTGNDMGISVYDFDNDGDLDVYSTNITDATGVFGTTQFNTLLVNQLDGTGSLTFVNQAEARGVRDTYWGWGAEFVDVDNDGDLDLYAVNGFDEFVSPFGSSLVDTPEVLFVNNGTGIFARSTGTGADLITDARAAIALDYNLDGRQDLLVTSILDPLVLLENQSTTGNWLSVELVGLCGDNANAVGGRVMVTTDGATQMREVIAGGSYLSGRPFAQPFGVGESAAVDQLIALFPDGSQFIRKLPPIVNRRTAILHETQNAPGLLIVSRDLRDFAAFQRCMGSSYDSGSECEPLDTDADQDGVIDISDLDDFLLSLNWTLPGCVTP